MQKTHWFEGSYESQFIITCTQVTLLSQLGTKWNTVSPDFLSTGCGKERVMEHRVRGSRIGRAEPFCRTQEPSQNEA